jgi:hypothetical protein
MDIEKFDENHIYARMFIRKHQDCKPNLIFILEFYKNGKYKDKYIIINDYEVFLFRKCKSLIDLVLDYIWVLNIIEPDDTYAKEFFKQYFIKHKQEARFQRRKLFLSILLNISS